MSDSESDSESQSSVDLAKFQPRYSEVKKLVRTIFSTEFTIIDVHPSGPPSFKIIKGVKMCLYFKFKIDLSELHIYTLNKCDGSGGSVLLKKVDDLVASIKECQVITLSDKSTITRCGRVINLAKLEILMTGNSWYNNRGYIQTNYPNDSSWNQKFIALPVSHAQEIIGNPDIDEDIAYLGSVIPQLNSSLPLTVYIQILFGYIKSKSYPEDGCDFEQNSFIEIVENVIEAFGGLLQYNESNEYLRKYVPTGLSSSGGGKKRIMHKSLRRTKTRPRKTKTRPRKIKTMMKR
jgi:hypothetical protein